MVMIIILSRRVVVRVMEPVHVKYSEWCPTREGVMEGFAGILRAGGRAFMSTLLGTQHRVAPQGPMGWAPWHRDGQPCRGHCLHFL